MSNNEFDHSHGDSKKTWRINQRFKSIFGDACKSDWDGMVIAFNLGNRDASKHGEFVIERAAHYGLPVYHHLTEKDMLLVVVPYMSHIDEKDAQKKHYGRIGNFLKDLEEHKELRQWVTDSGAYEAALHSFDLRNVLDHITGVNWVASESSEYDVDALKPINIWPEGEEARTKRIHALTPVLFERHAQERADEWLGYQREVEGKRGLDPRTAIPDEWLTDLKVIRRAGELKTDDRAELQKKFRS